MKIKTLLFIILLSLVQSDEKVPENGVCEEPSEVWFKISNEVGSDNYGKIMQLDMTKGYATTDGVYVYLFVQEKNTPNGIVISFPIGYWETESIIKPNSKEDEKPFDLDEYLKNNRGKGIKIESRRN